MEKRGISVKEFAESYNIGLSTAWKLVKTAGFPAIRLGKRIIIPVDLLTAWMATQPTVGESGAFSPAS